MDDENFVERFKIEDKNWESGGAKGRVTGWESSTAQQIRDAKTFAEGYLRSLRNKSVWQRLKFLESSLRRNGYRSIEEVSGSSYEAAFRESPRRVKSGTKFYSYIDKTMLVAVEIGTAPLRDGILLGGAHIDSIALVGVSDPIVSNFNIAYFPCTPREALSQKILWEFPYHCIIMVQLPETEQEGLMIS